ncbi:hypothetical protein LCGC14_1925080, partial [marine sediment metagenome]
MKEHARLGLEQGIPKAVVQKNGDVGAIACLFSDHPKAGEWAKRAVEAVDVVLESKEYMPAGSQDEWY